MRAGCREVAGCAIKHSRVRGGFDQFAAGDFSRGRARKPRQARRAPTSPRDRRTLGHTGLRVRHRRPNGVAAKNILSAVPGCARAPSRQRVRVLKTKSVHSPIEPADGLRILATRFRGRGLPTNRYHVWMASLGPSERLLKSVMAGRIAWREFLKRYRAEMFAPAATDAGNATIKNHGQKFTLRLIAKLAAKENVTLLCHCAEDAKECHRFELQKLIAREMDAKT
jgi:uncharacterized protein YeaO (DUF488 family)